MRVVRKNRFLFLVVLLLGGLVVSGCKKVNPSKDRYLKGKWTITSITLETNEYKNILVEPGELIFKGMKNKAKRGSFDYTIKKDGKIIRHEGSFMWWIDKGEMIALNKNDIVYEGKYETQEWLGVMAYMNMDNVDDKVLGIVDSSLGAFGFSFQDENHFRTALSDGVDTYYFKFERK